MLNPDCSLGIPEEKSKRKKKVNFSPAFGAYI